MSTIPLTPSQASNPISSSLRNNIYSSLLSGTGIRNIETTLDRQLSESGFKDELRRYVTDLFRSGQATTFDEAVTMAMEKIQAMMRGDDEMSNGTNGVNGVNGNGSHDGDGVGEKYDLRIPEKAVREGVRTVRRELEKVCELTEED